MPDGATRFPWPPRGMSEKAAAYYLGLSPSTFRAAVAPEVPSVRATQGRVVWLKEDLDAWLDKRAGKIVDLVPVAAQPAAGAPSDDPIAAALAALRPAKGRSRRQGQTGRR